jgi:hypothetical protein
MKSPALTILLVGCIATSAALAGAPAAAPSGTTATCKDGTYSSAEKKSGACSGHHGVKEWYGEETAASTKASKTTPAATTTTAPQSTAAAPVESTTTRKTSTTPVGHSSDGVTGKAAGSAGQVWVNTSTKVYHCSGDRWYGKTKQGEYLSESDAKAKGFRPEHGKTCS